MAAVPSAAGPTASTLSSPLSFHRPRRHPNLPLVLRPSFPCRRRSSPGTGSGVRVNRTLRVLVAHATSGRGRRALREWQDEGTPLAPAQQIASSLVPAAAFAAATFVLWKLVEKLLMPKWAASASADSKSPSDGMKWSIATSTNLLSNLNAKIDRQSKLKINEFAKELRSFRSVDMPGRNFGDEGFFFLAESLGYNQVVSAPTRDVAHVV